MAGFFEGPNPTDIFLSSLTAKLCWAVVRECTSQLGRPFTECEDLAQKPKAVIPSWKKKNNFLEFH